MTRRYPGAAAVSEDQLLAIAYACGLLPRPAEPDPSEVTNLVPTPEAEVWFDPATGTRVHVPAGTRRAS